MNHTGVAEKAAAGVATVAAVAMVRTPPMRTTATSALVPIAILVVRLRRPLICLSLSLCRSPFALHMSSVPHVALRVDGDGEAACSRLVMLGESSR